MHNFYICIDMLMPCHVINVEISNYTDWKD